MRKILLLVLLLVACESRYLRDARSALDAKDYDRAATLIDIELKKHPDSLDAHLFVGELALRRGNEYEAQKAFERAQIIEPAATSAIVGLYTTTAQALLNAPLQDERADRAFKYIKIANELDPNAQERFEAWIISTARERFKEEPDEGASLINRWVREHPFPARDAASQLHLDAARRREKEGKIDSALYLYRGAGSHGARKEAAESIVRIMNAHPEITTGDHLDAAMHFDPSLSEDDDLYWRATQGSPSSYLLRFPDGKHAQEAREQLPPDDPLATVTSKPAPFGGDALPVGGDVTRPVPIERPPAQYTAAARTARIEGIVIVEAIINADGTVQDVKVLKPLPHGLDEEARRAVKTWRFQPGTRHGKPVKTVQALTVSFKL